MTGVVKQSSGAIGYVELTYAEENHLPVAQVQNLAGKYVSPTAAGTSAAIDAFSGELVERRAHANRECSGVGARCLSHQWPHFPACAKTSKRRQ